MIFHKSGDPTEILHCDFVIRLICITVSSRRYYCGVSSVCIKSVYSLQNKIEHILSKTDRIINILKIF